MSSYKYKKTHPNFGEPLLTSEKRKNECERIVSRYPDRIPVVCEKSSTSKLPDLDKEK